MAKKQFKGTELVEKRNILNEIRSNSMTLQELRFFSIYLSKINARDISSRKVRFNLTDFQKIMSLGKMNIKHFKDTFNGLLCKVVHIPTATGGLSAFQLFKKCTLDKDKCGVWYVEIDAHDDALPLMFNFKKDYFTYELWNALRLKSANQVRMYELLKQYEKIGKREITVSELRELLGILPKEYPRWDRFRERVIDSCQKALSENTDISFTYERGKTGKGGKWITIIFHIYKNESYKDPLSLKDFIDLQPASETENNENISEIAFNAPRSLSNALETQQHTTYTDLSELQIEALQALICTKLSGSNSSERAEKLLKAFYLDMKAENESVTNPYKYLKAVIKNLKEETASKNSNDDDEEDYEYAEFVNNF